MLSSRCTGMAMCPWYLNRRIRWKIRAHVTLPLDQHYKMILPKYVGVGVGVEIVANG